MNVSENKGKALGGKNNDGKDLVSFVDNPTYTNTHVVEFGVYIKCHNEKSTKNALMAAQQKSCSSLESTQQKAN